MPTAYLGKSALRVSRICLGAMLFGGVTDEATARRIIGDAAARGVNFIDTADVYNDGGSEEVVGRAIAQERDRWVIATKFGGPMGAAANQGGASRKWIFEAVENSLRRLGTDYIDIIYIHKPYTDQPQHEAVRAVGDLIAQGKLRYFALSNYHGWRIAEVCAIADALGIARPIASQPLYNIVSRGAEVEQFPAAANFGLGLVPYSPLARGVLSGKYQVDAPPPAESRAGRADVRLMQTEWRRESREIAQRIAAHAEGKGCSAAEFAIAWVLANPLVTSIIAGPRTQEQWRTYCRALDVFIDGEDEELVNSLVAPGHASSHGYSDPAYPVEGRPARPMPAR